MDSAQPYSMEELEALYIWMRLLMPHKPIKQKHYILSMHSFGIMSDFTVTALFKAFDLENE